MFARQPCCRIPGRPGVRPVVLRPTLLGGLPLSGPDSTVSRSKVAAIESEAQALENNGRSQGLDVSSDAWPT